MSFKEKLPFLKPLLSDREKGELGGAMEAERLAVDYKIKQEEMLSIFDETKEYLDYGSIINSGAYGTLPEELRERIEEHSRAKGKNILFADFRELWENSPQVFLTSLVRSVREREKNNLSATGEKADKATMQQLIKSRTLGISTRLAYMMNFHFNRLNSEMKNIDPEEMAKIRLFARSNAPKVRQALGDIGEMMEGIEAAKNSKSVEAVRKPAETAAVHGADEGDVLGFNALLEGVFEDEFNESFSLGIEEKYDQTGNIVEKDFLTAYVNYHREMKNLYEMLNAGKIVETAYIKEIIEKALPALKKNPPTIVYLHGDFGTGKTALANHISKTRFGKEPIVVAGSKYLEPDRFTEEFKISRLESRDFLNHMMKDLGKKEQFEEDTPLEDILLKGSIATKQELRESLRERYLKGKFTASLGDKEMETDEFNKKYDEFRQNFDDKELNRDVDEEIENLFTNQVQGRHILGAMYQCMKEGRPLIIDEANAISPDVVIAFNDLLTRRIGEKIKVRSDEKEITIKDGYCVIWTGNTGERYKQARYNDMDPATFSRLAPIQVNYLPQATEVNNMNSLMKRLEVDKLEDAVFTDEDEMKEYIKQGKKQAAGDQIFQVMLVKLLNKRLGAEMLARKNDRYSVFKDIYRLSMGARIIMDVFEGKTDRIPSLPGIEKLIGVSDNVSLSKKLKKSNLTMRELMDNIIGEYLDNGQSLDIEYYLYKYVQKQEMHPEEQAILYAILQKTGFFPPNGGWPDYQAVSGDTDMAMHQYKEMMKLNPVEKIDKYKNIRKNGEYVSLLNTKGEYKYEYFSSLETVQLLFGHLPARQAPYYEGIKNKQTEVAGESEDYQRKKEVKETLREIIAMLSPDLFPTSAKAAEVLSAIKNLRLSKKGAGTADELSEEEFGAELNKFHAIMLNCMKEAGVISSDEFEEAQDMDGAAKTEFIKNKLAGRQK